MRWQRVFKELGRSGRMAHRHLLAWQKHGVLDWLQARHVETLRRGQATAQCGGDRQLFLGSTLQAMCRDRDEPRGMCEQVL